MHQEAARAIDLVTFTQPPPPDWKADADDDQFPIVTLLQVQNYSEKQGFSLLWIRSYERKNHDIHGRALLSLYRHYGSLVIEILFIRIILQ